MKRLVLILSIALLCISCGTNYSKASNYVDNLLQEKKDAMEYLEEIFVEKKIILIGSTDHSLINDTLFLSYENLLRLYKKGLRYIFLERGFENGPVFKEKDRNNNVLLFYPWENVGVQSVEHTIIDNILEINNSVAVDNPINIIGLESGRNNFQIADNDYEKILNYRDRYMFETASRYIDNLSPGEKVLIVCGADHGIKNKISNINPYSGLRYDWFTLGYYLDNHYRGDFCSLTYLALDSYTNDSVFYKELRNSNWDKTNIISKIITYEDLENIDKKISVIFNNNYKGFDNFIIDKKSQYGVKYCYTLDSIENINSIIASVKEVYNYFAAKNFIIDYEDLNESYLLESFTRNIYYLCFAYGENFPYTFWNPKCSLLEALSVLEQNLTIVRKINSEDAKQYQLLIRGMYYLKNSRNTANTNYYLKKGSWQMKQAKMVISDEIWTDYWFVIMNYRLRNYKKTLVLCEQLLANELVYSSICLPEIYSIKKECMEKVYHKSVNKDDIEMLRNELKIDVSKMNLFLN